MPVYVALGKSVKMSVKCLVPDETTITFKRPDGRLVGEPLRLAASEFKPIPDDPKKRHKATYAWTGAGLEQGEGFVKLSMENDKKESSSKPTEVVVYRDHLVVKAVEPGAPNDPMGGVRCRVKVVPDAQWKEASKFELAGFSAEKDTLPDGTATFENLPFGENGLVEVEFLSPSSLEAWVTPAGPMRTAKVRKNHRVQLVWPPPLREVVPSGVSDPKERSAKAQTAPQEDPPHKQWVNLDEAKARKANDPGAGPGYGSRVLVKVKVVDEKPAGQRVWLGALFDKDNSKRTGQPRPSLDGIEPTAVGEDEKFSKGAGRWVTSSKAVGPDGVASFALELGAAGGDKVKLFAAGHGKVSKLQHDDYSALESWRRLELHTAKIKAVKSQTDSAAVPADFQAKVDAAAPKIPPEAKALVERQLALAFVEVRWDESSEIELGHGSLGVITEDPADHDLSKALRLDPAGKSLLFTRDGSPQEAGKPVTEATFYPPRIYLVPLSRIITRSRVGSWAFDLEPSEEDYATPGGDGTQHKQAVSNIRSSIPLPNTSGFFLRKDWRRNSSVLPWSGAKASYWQLASGGEERPITDEYLDIDKESNYVMAALKVPKADRPYLKSKAKVFLKLQLYSGYAGGSTGHWISLTIPNPPPDDPKAASKVPKIVYTLLHELGHAFRLAVRDPASIGYGPDASNANAYVRDVQPPETPHCSDGLTAEVKSKDPWNDSTSKVCGACIMYSPAGDESPTAYCETCLAHLKAASMGWFPFGGKEPPPPPKLEVVPKILCDRIRAAWNPYKQRAEAVHFEVEIECSDRTRLGGYEAQLKRSSATVEIFEDRLCQRPLAFKGEVAALPMSRFEAGERIPLWARPTKDDPFTLNLQVTEKGKPAPAASAEKKLKKSLGFLDSHFLELADSFASVDEILAQLPRIRSISALADMSAEDFANFAIKRLVIRKGVLEQEVEVKLCGEDGAEKKVKLGHPLAPAFPLHYSDFLVDRSGPKFLGALQAEVAVETLMYKDAVISSLLARQDDLARDAGREPTFDRDLVQMVRDLSERRLAELQARNADGYAQLTEAEVEKATSVFTLRHMAQRKLSDFDLTARDSETLARAIGHAVREELHDRPKPLSDELVLEIGRTAWTEGGPIDLRLVKAALDADGTGGKSAAVHYREKAKADERFRADPKNAKFYHVLIDELGPKVKALLPNAIPVIDNFYGLGVPYYGFEVHEHEGKLEFHAPLANSDVAPKVKHEGREEIGDVITDETSHYGRVFSHVRNMQEALNKLTRTGEAWSAGAFDKAKSFRDNVRELMAKSKQAAIVAAYQDKEAFIDTVLMFEQVAKKEAQAQYFKAEGAEGASKLMGNVSDLSQFLYGLDIARRVASADGKAAEVKRFEALLDVVKLSCLVNFPRWDISAANCAQVGDTAGAIGAEQFRWSINFRSYGHFAKKAPRGQEKEAEKKDMEWPDDWHSWPRVHLEWAGIDAKIAAQRLDDFKVGMQPVWELIQGQAEFFKAADALSAALRNSQDPAPARTAVRRELDKVLAVVPALVEQVTAFGESRGDFIEFLARQVEESCVFWGLRDAKKKPAPKKD